jgi:hypothetical protein
MNYLLLGLQTADNAGYFQRTPVYYLLNFIFENLINDGKPCNK